MKYDAKQREDEAGFTLIEMIIVVLIASVLMGVVMSTFIQYVNTSAQQSAQDDINAEVASLFKVIEKDVMMAGYGLPSRTRVASHFNCNVGDQTFCVNGTARLFISDGWQIIKAITDNGEDDGQIVTTPNNYLTYITVSKSSTAGGYGTTLKADILPGTNIITLLSLNINAGEEFTVTTTDFYKDSAFIIGDNTRVEGHTIKVVSPLDKVETVSFDPVINPYQTSATHSVVPAHVWYVRNDPDGKTFRDGSPVNWLYRNGFKVLPNVSNFNVKYGYDTKNDGIQWSDTVPPANNNTDLVSGTYDNWASTPPISGTPNGPDSIPYDFSGLKVIQITLTVKSMYKTEVKSFTYQTTILLRN